MVKRRNGVNCNRMWAGNFARIIIEKYLKHETV